MPVTTFPNPGSASTLGNVQLHYRPGVLQIPGDGHNALRDLAASYAQFREATGAVVPGVVVLKRTADVTAWLLRAEVRPSVTRAVMPVHRARQLACATKLAVAVLACICRALAACHSWCTSVVLAGGDLRSPGSKAASASPPRPVRCAVLRHNGPPVPDSPPFALHERACASSARAAASLACRRPPAARQAWTPHYCVRWWRSTST